ncbi:MAG: hypothetical protein ACO29V_13335 [Limnohabitans sp.]
MTSLYVSPFSTEFNITSCANWASSASIWHSLEDRRGYESQERQAAYLHELMGHRADQQEY